MAVNQQFSAPAHGLVNLDQYYPNVSLLLHFDGSNGSTTFTDNSPSPNTVTANGNAQVNTSVVKYGTGSGIFDGSGDYLSIPSNTAFDLGTVFTIECWVRPSSVSINAGIVSRGLYISAGTSWTGLAFSIRQLNSAIRFYFYATVQANEQYIEASSALIIDTWAHIAMVRNGTTGQVFINGVSAGVINGLNTPAASSRPVSIGRWDFSIGDEYFNGYIDDLRITKGVARYTSNFNPPGAPFPDNSYSKFYSDPDYSSVSLLLHGDGSNGGLTFTDNSRFTRTPSAISNAVTSTTQKKFGVASIYTPAVTANQLRYASSSDFNISGVDFTIEMWFYRTGGQTALVCRRDPGISGFTSGWVLNTNGIRANINGVWSDTQITWADPGLNTWNHIAWTVSGTTMRVFLNGVLAGTKTSVTSINDTAATLDFAQSAAGGENLYQGFIDDFRFTRGVARYTSNFTPPAAPHPNLGVQTNWIDNIYADQWYGNTVLLLHCDGAGSGTTFRDSSPQVNTVTANGNAITSTAATKWGPTSAAFDGTNSFLSLTYSSAFQFGSGNFTIEMWVYPSSTPNGSALYAETYTGTGDEVSLAIGFCNGTLGSIVGSLPFVGFFSGGAWTGAAASSALTNGVWSFLAYVRNGSTHTLYVNGTSVASFTYAGALPTDADGLIIGRRWDTDQPGNSPYFPGYIDDLRITKGVARYTAAFTPPAAPFPNLAPPGYDPFYQRTSLLLHMDGANGGTTFTDNSPTPKAVTANGNAVTSTSVVKYGSASAFFDGNGDYLSTPDSADIEFGSGDFTVEAWIYPVTLPAAAAYRGIVGQRQQGSGPVAWTLLITGDASSKIMFEWSTTGTSSAGTAYSATAPVINQWSHVAVSRSGSNVVVFLNGVAGPSSNIGTSVIANVSVPLTVGVLSYGIPVGWFDGYIDELRITKGVARYTANFQPPTGPFPNR